MATDDFDFDDFDFDDFDWENGDGDYQGNNKKAKSKKRVVIENLTGGFVSGLVSSAGSRENQKKFIDAALPKSYGVAYEALLNTKDGIENIYKTAVDETDKLSNKTALKMKPLVERYSEKLPLKMRGPLRKWTQNARSASAFTEENREELEAVATLNDIFSKQNQEVLAREQTGDLKAQTALAKNANFLTQRLLLNQQRQLSYQDNIDAQWKKKTLELQFKQYYVQRKTLDVNQQLLGLHKASMEALIKNTAMPDFLKITATEMAKETAINSLFNKTYQKFGHIPSDIIKTAFTNVNKKVKAGFKSADNGFEDAFMMLEMAISGVEAGSELGVAEQSYESGHGAGTTVGGFASSRLGKWLSNTGVIRNKKISKLGAKLDVLAKSGGRRLNRAIRHGTDNDFIDAIMELTELKQLVTGSDNLIMGKAGDKLDSAAYFDILSKKALTEVIPGYLARIHSEVSSIRTGKKADLLIYDYNRNTFKTSKMTRREIREYLVAQNDKENLNVMHNELAHVLNLDQGLSKEAKNALLLKMTLAAIEGGDFSFNDIVAGNGPFKDPNVAKEIRDFIKANFDINENTEGGVIGSMQASFRDSEDGAKIQATIYKWLNEVGNMIRNPVDRMGNIASMGPEHVGVLRSLGLTEDNDDGLVLNNERFVRELMRGRTVRANDYTPSLYYTDEFGNRVNRETGEVDKDKDAMDRVIGYAKDWGREKYNDTKDKVTGLISRIKGYSKGGYTGDGKETEAAGIVHKGEYVVPKKILDKIGPQTMDKVTEYIKNTKEGVNSIKSKLNNITENTDSKLKDIKEKTILFANNVKEKSSLPLTEKKDIIGGKINKRVMAIKRIVGKDVSNIPEYMDNEGDSTNWLLSVLTATSVKSTKILEEKFKSKKKFNDSDGDGDRDGNAKDEHEENKESKEEESKEKSRSLKERIKERISKVGKKEEKEKKKRGGIFGLMSSMLGLVGGIAKTAFGIGKGIFTVGTWLARGVGWLARLFPWLIRGGAAFLGTTAGVATVGTAAAGYVGYRGYKNYQNDELMNKKDVDGIDEFLPDAVNNKFTRATVRTGSELIKYLPFASTVDFAYRKSNEIDGKIIKTKDMLINELPDSQSLSNGLFSLAVGSLRYGLKALFGSDLEKQPILRYRMAQYGAKYWDSILIEGILKLEEFLLKYTIPATSSKPAAFSDDVTVRKVANIFGIDVGKALGDKELNIDSNEREYKALEKLLGWFNYRFKPVYLSHVTILHRLKGNSVKLPDADKSLVKSEKEKYINDVDFNSYENNPYAIPMSPLRDRKKLDIVGIGKVVDVKSTVLGIISAMKDETPKGQTGNQNKPEEVAKRAEAKIQSSVAKADRTISKTETKTEAEKPQSVLGKMIAGLGLGLVDNKGKNNDKQVLTQLFGTATATNMSKGAVQQVGGGVKKTGILSSIGESVSKALGFGTTSSSTGKQMTVMDTLKNLVAPGVSGVSSVASSVVNSVGNFVSDTIDSITGSNNIKVASSTVEFAKSFTKGLRIGNLSELQTAALAANTAQTESNFRMGIRNKQGYSGLYQFGGGALGDIGYMRIIRGGWKKQNAAMTSPSNWLNGLSLEKFLGSRQLQDAAYVKLANKNISYGRSQAGGRVREFEQKIATVEGMAKYLKMAHLKGSSAAVKGLLDGKDARDGNGTSMIKYGDGAARNVGAIVKALGGTTNVGVSNQQTGKVAGTNSVLKPTSTYMGNSANSLSELTSKTIGNTASGKLTETTQKAKSKNGKTKLDPTNNNFPPINGNNGKETADLNKISDNFTAKIIVPATGDEPFDIASFVNKLKKNGLGKSTGKCALFVRKAAGWSPLAPDAWGYHTSGALLKKGFHQIDNASTYQPGDIAVTQATAKHVHGHISGYTGEQWISDFKQQSIHVYASKPEIYLYRHKNAGTFATDSGNSANTSDGVSSEGSIPKAPKAITYTDWRAKLAGKDSTIKGVGYKFQSTFRPEKIPVNNGKDVNMILNERSKEGKYGRDAIVVERVSENANGTKSIIYVYGQYIFKGFEAPGPSTTKSGTKKRIPAGKYNIAPHKGTKRPDHFVLFNENVSRSRAILFHEGDRTGKWPENVEGCILVGKEWNGDGIDVSTSPEAWKHFKTIVKEHGVGSSSVHIVDKWEEEKKSGSDFESDELKNMGKGYKKSKEKSRTNDATTSGKKGRYTKLSKEEIEKEVEQRSEHLVKVGEDFIQVTANGAKQAGIDPSTLIAGKRAVDPNKPMTENNTLNSEATIQSEIVNRDTLSIKREGYLTKDNKLVYKYFDANGKEIHSSKLTFVRDREMAIASKKRVLSEVENNELVALGIGALEKINKWRRDNGLETHVLERDDLRKLGTAVYNEQHKKIEREEKYGIRVKQPKTVTNAIENTDKVIEDNNKVIAKPPNVKSNNEVVMEQMTAQQLAVKKQQEEDFYKKQSEQNKKAKEDQTAKLQQKQYEYSKVVIEDGNKILNEQLRVQNLMLDRLNSIDVNMARLSNGKTYAGKTAGSVNPIPVTNPVNLQKVLQPSQTDSKPSDESNKAQKAMERLVAEKNRGVSRVGKIEPVSMNK